MYTGNLGNLRYENLYLIGKALDRINGVGGTTISNLLPKNASQFVHTDGGATTKAILEIYSATPLTKDMESKFNECESIKFMGRVSAKEVVEIQEMADILIHTESFDPKEIHNVRMSLSTKIIDYLSRGKCILAVGSKEVTSIDYFVTNDCGMVASTEEEIFKCLEMLINNKEIIYTYAQRALNTAIRNHNPEKLHKEFYKDLLSVLK